MNKNTAEKIIESLAWIEHPIGLLDLAITELKDDEKTELVQLTGKIMQNQFEIIQLIIKQYPELDPDNKGKTIYQNFKDKHEYQNT